MTTVVFHPATKVWLDYGSELEREHGVILRINGHLQGFEGGKSADGELARWALLLEAGGLSSRFDLSVGEPIERRVDMNPNGLV